MKALLLVSLIGWHLSCFAEPRPDWSLIRFQSDSASESLREAFSRKQWTKYYQEIYDDDLIARTEGYRKYLLGLGLLKNGYPVAAYSVFAKFLKDHSTSPLINPALSYITESFLSDKIELSFLQELLDKSLLSPKTPQAKSIYHYLRALTLKDKGFANWSDTEIRSIPRSTYWSYHKTYVKLLMASTRKSANEMVQKWLRFFKLSKLPENLKESSRLHIARMLYEMGKFKRAEGFYEQIRLNRFDHGTVLRERAWLYFRQKNYKEAVGMLDQLRSSLYGIYHHVDEYLLTALIYREHCQEELLSGVVKDLESEIESIEADIKKLNIYADNPSLLRYAIFHPNIKNHSRLLTYIQEEQKDLSEELPDEALKTTKNAMNQLKRFTAKRINLTLETPVRDTIEDFLDLKDQVKYLIYAIKLRSMKENPQSYEESVKKIRQRQGGTKIVWPVINEIWADEVKTYKAVLENLCLR